MTPILSPGDMFYITDSYTAWMGIPEGIKMEQLSEKIGKCQCFRLQTNELVVCVKIEVRPDSQLQKVFYNILFMHPEHGRCLMLGRSPGYIRVVREEEKDI